MIEDQTQTPSYTDGGFIPGIIPCPIYHPEGGTAAQGQSLPVAMESVDGKPLHPKAFSLSVIIPTMNESRNISFVFPKIPSMVDEIIVVDSSDDNTIEVIKEYASHARIIKTEPKGKGNALKVGFQYVTGDIVVMLDADGSMDPEEIPRFYEPLTNGHDVVQGSRILGGSEDLTPLRKFGNFFFVSLVNALFDCHYTDLCYGYRGYKKAVIDQIDFDADGFDIETELTIKTRKNGFRICEVPSYEGRRVHGKSNLRTFRDGWKILYRILREWSN